MFKEFAESKNVSTDAPKEPAAANVLARLFKSNPVKNVVPNTLAEIRKLLGVDDAPAAKQGKLDTKKEAISKEKKEKPESRKVEESVSASEDGAAHTKTDDMSISEDGGFESEEFAEFNDRLGPGSDSEDESEADEPATKDKALAADDISDSVSRSPSPTFSAADSPPPKKAKASKAASAPAQNTTFLPSLMMGGYWSGSEEATDDEAAAGPPKRKNRMGQQARRALWEKKYGGSANHVLEEQKQQKRNRDSGWDTKRGATGSGAGGRGRGRGGGFGQNRHDGRGGPHSTSGPSHGGKPQGPPKDEGPLHPSWEAKRRQKEQGSTAAFAGKKTTFD